MTEEIEKELEQFPGVKLEFEHTDCYSHGYPLAWKFLLKCEKKDGAYIFRGFYKKCRAHLRYPDTPKPSLLKRMFTSASWTKKWIFDKWPTQWVKMSLAILEEKGPLYYHDTLTNAFRQSIVDYENQANRVARYKALVEGIPEEGPYR